MYEKVLDKLMHLADLDENGTIDKYELTHNLKASSVLEKYFNQTEPRRDFLTKGDIVELIPELQVLENLVEELKSCLSGASYDLFLSNKKMKPVRVFLLLLLFFHFLL